MSTQVLMVLDTVYSIEGHFLPLVITAACQQDTSNLPIIPHRTNHISAWISGCCATKLLPMQHSGAGPFKMLMAKGSLDCSITTRLCLAMAVHTHQGPQNESSILL